MHGVNPRTQLTFIITVVINLIIERLTRAATAMYAAKERFKRAATALCATNILMRGLLRPAEGRVRLRCYGDNEFVYCQVMVEGKV